MKRLIRFAAKLYPKAWFDRYTILAYSSLGAAKATGKPGESGKSSLTFLAPANARSLYLTGDIKAPLFVRLYFGSDLNPFHRRTLLRVV